MNALNKNAYDYVVTDLSFPPYETGLLEINMGTLLGKYDKFFGEVCEKEIPNGTLAKLYRESSYKNSGGELRLDEESFASRLIDITGRDFDEYFDRFLTPVQWFDYEEFMESLNEDRPPKISMFRKDPANGLKIVKECKERDIPVAVYTGDWAHGSGLYKIIEEDIINVDSVIAATLLNYGDLRRGRQPFNEEELCTKFGLKKFPLYRESNIADGRIISTNDFGFNIGKKKYAGAKDYSRILEEILKKKRK